MGMDAPKTKPTEPLSPQAAELLAIVKRWCRGPDQAHTDERLASMTGIPKRHIIDYANELNYAGHPVVASSSNPPGRFYTQDSKIIRRCGRKLDWRAIKILRHARALKSIADQFDAREKVEPHTGQMRMFT